MRYIRYEIWNVASAREWDFTLVVLRNCAPQREQDHWTYIYYRVEVLRVVGSRSSHDTKNVSSKCVGHTQQSGSSKTITSVWRYSGEHYSVLRDFNVWIFSTITTVRFGFSRFYRPKPLPPTLGSAPGSHDQSIVAEIAILGGKWFGIQDFTNFTAAAHWREVSRRELFEKIPSLRFVVEIALFQPLAKIHDHRWEWP